MPVHRKTTREMFGTDGVRGVANKGFMTPEAVMRLGCAYIEFLRIKGVSSPKIVVGMDTRISGEMLKAALTAGITASGGAVVDLGVIPTPGVSFAVFNGGYDGGAVVSASHNPAEYNGIKFLDNKGFKLTDIDETEIEAFYEYPDLLAVRPCGKTVGRVTGDHVMKTGYRGFLSSLLQQVKNKNYPLVVDAANGAASELVAPLMELWEGEAFLYGVSPDGVNINDGVGVTHMNLICGKTVENKAKLGVAYDGDADRVLFSDERGRVIDGDIMLWVIARWLAREKKLGSGVVATIMTNMALDDLLAKEEINVFRCDVGDRYVLETMQRSGCRLGGEQSGHILILDYANTGDGLCSGILFLRALAELGEDPGKLVDKFDRYPQILRNIKVENNKAVMAAPALAEACAEVEKMLKDKGRFSLRPSGTEPLIRIFVESRDTFLMNRAADFLEAEIERVLADNER